MRILAPLLVAMALTSTACKSRKEILDPDKDTMVNLPREVAVEKLRDVLPTAEVVYCLQPRDTLKPEEIKEWVMGSTGARIVLRKGTPYVLNYSEITSTQLAAAGKAFVARAFTSTSPPGKPLFEFQWSSEEPAKRAVHYLEAVRTR